MTTEFEIANMTGKSTTYLTAIHAQATEHGRSKLSKTFMEISVHLSAGKRNSLAKVNLESIAKQSHRRQETKPNVTVSHIKTMTLASPQLSS